MDDMLAGQTLRQKIRIFVEGRFPLVAAENLTDEDSLLDSGAIDSLGLLDVVGFLEEDLGLDIDDEDMEPENFQSISELTRFVEQKNGR